MLEIKSHPIYTSYGASEDGIVFNKYTKRALGPSIDISGYVSINLSIDGVARRYRLSRFVFECFNGHITNNNVIDHKDDNRLNNSIHNLQQVTQQENIKKKYQGGRFYNNKKKAVEATNINTNIITQYKSMTQAGIDLDICEPSVRRCCELIQKSAINKKNGSRYTFKYL